MPVLPLPVVAVAAALSLAAVAGCGGSNASATPKPVSTTAGPASASPSPSATASPSAATAPTSNAPTQAARTHGLLKKALLQLSDLPTGFQVEPAGSDDGSRASSPRAACAPLVKIFNADQPRGTLASADAAFSGGQDGPFVDESLDALPSSAAAAAFVAGFRKAVLACNELHVKVPGVGRSTVSVRQVSFEKIGDSSFAARMTADPGPLEGLEILAVGAQSGDVVVSLSLVAADASDAASATDDAVTKVAKVLGTGSTAS